MAKKSPVLKTLTGKQGPRSAKRSMEALKPIFRLSRLPFAGRLHPWLREEKTDMRWLPINEDIELPDNTPVPLELIYRFCEEASHRVIFDRCGCRISMQCKDYPIDIGCLLMGDSALESPPEVSREVGVEEAKEHVRRAVDAGLVPVVGKARLDNFLFGIKDRHRLLTVCLCCECCCITRFTRFAPLKRVEPLFPRLEGISIEVADECVGCGECVEHCYVEAIEIKDGRAVIGEFCRACGRCATVCPNGAVKVRIDDPDFMDKAYERIKSYVKFD